MSYETFEFTEAISPKFGMTYGWQIETAIALIRELQPEVHKCNFHLLLGGGVLNKGFSGKDLDLMAAPGSLTENAPNLKKLLQIFAEAGYEPEAVQRRHTGMLVYKLTGHIDLIVPLFVPISEEGIDVRDVGDSF